MNDLIVIIYLIDFLAQIKTIASVVIIFLAFSLLFCGLIYWVVGDDLANHEKMARVTFDVMPVCLIVSVVFWVLIPKQNSMYLMTRLYTAQKAVAFSDSKTAEQALNTLNAKLAEIEAESKKKVKELSEKSDDEHQE